jgi:hypothetical protein
MQNNNEFKKTNSNLKHKMNEQEKRIWDCESRRIEDVLEEYSSQKERTIYLKGYKEATKFLIESHENFEPRPISDYNNYLDDSD